MVLGSLGPEANSAIPVLSDVVRNDNDPQVRLSAFGAVTALDKTGEATMSLVEELVRGKDRRLAVRAVCTAAADAPGHRMDSSTPSNRRVAAEPSELRKKLKPFVNMVIEAVNDTDSELRRDALRGLFEMGPLPKEAVPALIDVLEMRYTPDCELVHQILENLNPETGKAFLPVLLKAAEAHRESGGENDGIAQQLYTVIHKIEGRSSRSPAEPPSGRIRPSPRGAAKGPAGPFGVPRPRAPSVPSGKAASEDKKAGA
jgi:hypothetical protein